MATNSSPPTNPTASSWQADSPMRPAPCLCAVTPRLAGSNCTQTGELTHVCGEHGVDVGGAKATRLAQAWRAGLPVLPGWVVPVQAARLALRSGAAALRSRGAAAGRRAVFAHQLD